MTRYIMLVECETDEQTLNDAVSVIETMLSYMTDNLLFIRTMLVADLEVDNEGQAVIYIGN